MDEGAELIAQHGGVERIVELAQQAAGEDVVVREFDGQILSTVPLHRMTEQAPEPTALTLHTLTGLDNYLEANRDELPVERLLVHVVSPCRVDVVSTIRSFQQRFTWVTAHARSRMGGAQFNFGRWLGTEQLTIAVQALFEDAGDRADVLRLIGTITDEVVRTEKDDGVTQKVTAKAGVALQEDVEVPNPVELAPYRTFPEVDQPVSPFILRVRKTEAGIEGALFEADGGAWQQTATHRIRAWLSERLDSEVTIIA